MQRDATEAIVKAGGSVLGSVSHPLGATDFGSYLLQAQASGAKVIALADTGADAINAIRQAAEFQIVGPDRRLAALFLQITDIDALGLNAAQGLILSEAFYWDLNDSTRAFAARFAERMGGKMPTEDQAAAYSATLAYLRAVKAAGTIEGDKVVAEMKKSPIDDPLFGHVVVRADGRATHAMYVFRVKAPQQSKSRYDVYDLDRNNSARSRLPAARPRRLPAREVTDRLGGHRLPSSFLGISRVRASFPMSAFAYL